MVSTKAEGLGARSVESLLIPATERECTVRRNGKPGARRISIAPSCLQRSRRYQSGRCRNGTNRNGPLDNDLIARSVPGISARRVKELSEGGDNVAQPPASGDREALSRIRAMRP